ncbi:hypothetical protein TWF696_004415 [Orbilia brochopaga]|uniref:Uncharacterized protein n=1 Tax=Orbilia brochopaga TaxID=3140254 RepID=A0AAV9V6V6_9PEZI
MSVYRRTAALHVRPPYTYIQRRKHASKAGPQQNAVAVADNRPVFADLKRVFDGDFDIEDIDLNDLPLSPIMDEKKWARRFKQDKKQGKLHPSEMSEEELALMRNPYANALASTIRLESWYRRSIPSFFLQKLQVRVHPETKDPWILPVGIRSRDAYKVTPGGSKYIGLNYTAVDFLKSRRYKKLQDQKFVISAVWRRDTADFVLKQLRERVCEEVADCQRCIMSANRDGGKWEDMRLGCLLVWEQPPTQGTVESVEPTPNATEDAAEESVADQASDIETRTEPDVNRPTREKKDETTSPGVGARVLVEVKGKLIPSYYMPLLLGSEQAAELKKQLKIEPVVRKNIVVSSPRSMKAQTWLWKLGGYLREPNTSLFSDIDAARQSEREFVIDAESQSPN